MSIHTPEELAAMRTSGRIVRLMLEAMKAAARSGISTSELDQIGGDVMREHGAISGPITVYQFPGVSCISVNDEIVHGIPSGRKLRNGDLLKLDVTISKDGFMADAAETVTVGPPITQSAIGSRLAVCAQRAFAAAMEVARRRPPRPRHWPRRRKRSDRGRLLRHPRLYADTASAAPSTKSPASPTGPTLQPPMF